jgi:hypothetical protein
LADVHQPGVRAIIEGVRAQGTRLTADNVVDLCLDIMGPLHVDARTREHLIDHLAAAGDLDFTANGEPSRAAERIRELLQLIVATREYQLA